MGITINMISALQKQLILVVVTCLLISVSNNVLSQDFKMVKPYKYMIGLYWSVIDDNGTRFDDAFNVDKTWNAKVFPTSFSFDYYFRKGLSAEAQISYNYYELGKVINGHTDREGHALTIDINGKYTFGYLMEQEFIDPFAVLGFGYTGREAVWPQNMLGINMGGGINFMIFQGLGIQWRSTAKMGVLPSFNDVKYDFLQHHFGLIYKFPEESDSNPFSKPKHKWTRKKYRWKKPGGR